MKCLTLFRRLHQALPWAAFVLVTVLGLLIGIINGDAVVSFFAVLVAVIGFARLAMKQSRLMVQLVTSILFCLFSCAVAIFLLTGLILMSTDSPIPDRLPTFFVFIFCSTGFAFALLFAYRAFSQACLCFKDLSFTPAVLVGPVSSKYEETNAANSQEYYLVIGTQRFEVTDYEYRALTCGDLASLSYWPNSRTAATAERYTSPPIWPTDVVRLAGALHAGEDCAFALHDALLDAGYPELAEHFRGEPRPWWLVELILAKAPVEPRGDQ